MLPDRVSNPGPLTYESGALPIALRGPAVHGDLNLEILNTKCIWIEVRLQTKRPKSRKINKPVHPPIVMNNDHITEVDNHKHLGVVFENTCTWYLHINMIISKTWQRIYSLRKLKFLLDRQSLQAIYISFIRPILLEYADVVWTNCTTYEEDE